MRTIGTITVNVCVSDAQWKRMKDADLEPICDAVSDVQDEVIAFVRDRIASEVGHGNFEVK